MIPSKACPILLRQTSSGLAVLAFRHPSAGFQLVKGGICPGETPEAAALRELSEESGITNASVVRDLGVWNSDFEGQTWSFQLCSTTEQLPEKWIFHTADDGGHDFDFFWHPLMSEASSAWHRVFQNALAYLREALARDCPLDDINDQNRRAYANMAVEYAGPEPAEDDPEMRERCRELFRNRLKGQDVLEIGCGPGVDSHCLQKKGLNVTATDFCKEFIDVVCARFPEVTAREMDMTKPDLGEGSFDGIYSFASFIHLPRNLAPDTLNGFRKLLRKRGILFMTLIDSSIHREYVIPNWGNRPANPMLFTCYPKSDIGHLFKTAGFSKIEFHGIRSALYENLPRLVERGVTNYQVIASRA